MAIRKIETLFRRSIPFLTLKISRRKMSMYVRNVPSITIIVMPAERNQCMRLESNQEIMKARLTECRNDAPSGDRELPCAERENGKGFSESPQKHTCPDCLVCQSCSEIRCQTCMSNSKQRSIPMSIQEQIDLYNKRNDGLF
jgi:hypothetical protein